jgi:hypothetical protein
MNIARVQHLEYWTWRRLSLAWISLLTGWLLLKALRLTDCVGLPIPERGLQIAARLTLPTASRFQ